MGQRASGGNLGGVSPENDRFTAAAETTLIFEATEARGANLEGGVGP